MALTNKVNLKAFKNIGRDCTIAGKETLSFLQNRVHTPLSTSLRLARNNDRPKETSRKILTP